MDVAAVFALILKGITVVQALVAAGQEIEPAIEAVVKLVKGAQKGTVTDQELSDTETLLDKQIGDFNLDMP